MQDGLRKRRICTTIRSIVCVSMSAMNTHLTPSSSSLLVLVASPTITLFHYVQVSSLRKTVPRVKSNSDGAFFYFLSLSLILSDSFHLSFSRQPFSLNRNFLSEKLTFSFYRYTISREWDVRFPLFS